MSRYASLRDDSGHTCHADQRGYFIYYDHLLRRDSTIILWQFLQCLHKIAFDYIRDANTTCSFPSAMYGTMVSAECNMGRAASFPYIGSNMGV